jgi:hypothetical protein
MVNSQDSAPPPAAAPAGDSSGAASTPAGNATSGAGEGSSGSSTGKDAAAPGEGGAAGDSSGAASTPAGSATNGAGEGSSSSSTGENAAEQGAESLAALEDSDKTQNTEGKETASGAPSLAAEEQSNGQTPTEKEAAQKTKDAQQKTKEAQDQKKKAEADKLAADAQLRAAESRSPIDPKEYAAAKQAEAAANKEQVDARKAEKDAEKATKDAQKASGEAAANGAKLRLAQNDQKQAQQEADAADAKLTNLKNKNPPASGEEIGKAQKESDAANKKLNEKTSEMNKYKEAGETPATRAASANKALSDADAAHTQAQNDVMKDQEELANAQANGDSGKIKAAQDKLALDQEKEKTTESDLKKARSASQKANSNLNAELMKTETPEQTRDRLAKEANANLSSAELTQEDAQNNFSNAQQDLQNAQASNAPAQKIGWFRRKLNVLKLKLKGADSNVTSAQNAANAASANVGSPVGMASQNLQQLQAQQDNLQSQRDAATGAAEAAGQVIKSEPQGSLAYNQAVEDKAAEEEKAAELQKKMETNNAAIGQAQAQLVVAQENETAYQKALEEKRIAKKDQKKAAAEEAACQKNLDQLKKDGGSEQQKAAAEAALMEARKRNSEAAALLSEKEASFTAAEERAMGPIQKMRMRLERNEKEIEELRIKKVRIDQNLEEQKGLLDQQEGKGDSKTKEIEKRISQLQFESDTADERIKNLQQMINKDQASIDAIDRSVSSSVIGEEEDLVQGERTIHEEYARLSKGTTAKITPEDREREEEWMALQPEAVDGRLPHRVDPLAPDAGDEESEGPRIPTFERGARQPVFGPGGGPVANFTSPGGMVPNFDKTANNIAKFAAGGAAVPTFASSGDVSFDNAAAPLPWSGSSAKVPSFATAQPATFGGGSGGPIPVFGTGTQNPFGGGSGGPVKGNVMAISPTLPGDGLTKIKTATHLVELAPPAVSEEKKQALLRAKEALTSATASLKAAEKTENLSTIANAQISRDVATLKYEQALNNASPLGVPETEASGWWNKDPSTPYSKYNVDGGGRMDAPLQTSERTEHFILSGLETIQPAHEEILSDGARVLAVENVGFSMKMGKAIPTIAPDFRKFLR